MRWPFGKQKQKGLMKELFVLHFEVVHFMKQKQRNKASETSQNTSKKQTKERKNK